MHRRSSRSHGSTRRADRRGGPGHQRTGRRPPSSHPARKRLHSPPAQQWCARHMPPPAGTEEKLFRGRTAQTQNTLLLLWFFPPPCLRVSLHPPPGSSTNNARLVLFEHLGPCHNICPRQQLQSRQSTWSRSRRCKRTRFLCLTRSAMGGGRTVRWRWTLWSVLSSVRISVKLTPSCSSSSRPAGASSRCCSQ